MKNLLVIFVLLCWACAKQDDESEKKTITQLIEDETRYAAAADTSNWADTWVRSDEARFVYVGNDGVHEYKGWDSIKGFIKDAKPFDLQLKRDNYQIIICKDVAFASFDQQDNWQGVEGGKKKETRLIKKVDGKWKIAEVNVINISSFEKKNTGSFHIAKEKIAVDPESSFRNQSGLGGMAVGYIEVPAGTDFSPMFAGLPHDMCPSPHWGYIFEGSLRVKYPDGKEEVLNAGEVFYLPAPHTGIVEKDLKFIDFSPEQEISQLMDHVAKQRAAQNIKEN